ncbi:MAG: carboxylesterase family protein [Hyphomonadaceae bacterium]|nr:carboxylesterase family protein [Hyphomonadaceae bacterium]
MASEITLSDTTAGTVRGLRHDGVHVFKGVRYGASTGGKNRFRAPQPPTPWTGAVDAFDYGAPAPQLYSLSQPGLIELEHRPESEDCLFLNVWTPSLEGRRAVMVWLHAGGFFMGSGSAAVNDGTRLAAKQDVVVITLNHRLGLFGHLDLSAYGDEFAQSRNAGVLDIVQALEWIRDNVERFGGDPDRVMVFGESGGGWKISTLLAMKAAEGLFQRAGLQSGSRLRVDTRDAAAAKTPKVLTSLGILPTEVHRLQDMDMAEIQRLTPRIVTRPDEWQPVVDGALIDRQPFSPDAPETARWIPMIIGTTRTENAYNLAGDGAMKGLTDLGLRQMFIQLAGERVDEALSIYRKLYPDRGNAEIAYMAHTDRSWYLDAQLLADRKARQEGAPTYFYSFERDTPVQGGRFFTPHTAELPFVFDTLESIPQAVGPVTDAAQALADTMSAAWANFAKEGTPTAPSLPSWTEYNPGARSTMIFKEGRCEVLANPKATQSAFWASLGSLQET